MSSLLQSTCLQPSYSLRRQLLQSFGLTAFLTLALVVLMAVVFSFGSAGLLMNRHTNERLRQQVIDTMIESSKFSAERFSGKMENVEGMIQVIASFVQDRIVGYPNDGWENDEHVPFRDVDTGENRYPLSSPNVPLDWQIKYASNIKESSSNNDEHFQERAGTEAVRRYSTAGAVSTASASYRMQGTCDVGDDDANSPTYYENCSEENNNFETGGVVQPTNTSKGLYAKSADISVILKPLYEAEPSVFTLDVWFHNSGAGASLSYPGHVHDGTSDRYVSNGCDWMRQTNPMNNRSYATDEEIARCHRKGTLVSQRDFNPMEQEWCEIFATNTDQVSWYGPTYSYGNGNALVLLVGRGIFDRFTQNFIGCVSVSILLDDMSEFLIETRLPHMENSVVRFADHTLLADTLNSVNKSGTATLHVTDSDVITQENYDELLANLNYENNWTPVVTFPGGIHTGYPLPIPTDADGPSYQPDFIFLHFISNDVFEEIDALDREIDDSVFRLGLTSASIAIAGVIIIFAIVWGVSSVLTEPLLWMEKVAWGIVNHADERANETLRTPEHEEETMATLECSPSTEITSLVSEFGAMIRGFSGAGGSTVAQSELYEIPNELTWRSDFSELYTYNPVPVRSKYSNNTPATEDETNSPSSDTNQIGGKDAGTKVPSVQITDANRSASGSRQAADDGSGVVKSIVPAPPKKNLGSNMIMLRPKKSNSRRGFKDRMGPKEIIAYRSKLFWWIVVLIVVPILLTNLVILIIVSTRIVNVVPDWVSTVELASKELEETALQSYAELKASYAEMNMQQVARDLHILTRMAGWLFFEGILRSGSLTGVEEATEECKIYPKGICPLFFDSPDRAPCACEWKDAFSENCTVYGEQEARARQSGSFTVQRRDADPATGVRDRASGFFDDGFDKLPNTTLWWDNLSVLPGNQVGEGAKGWSTTYDKIRVASAMATVEMPIYNYAQQLNRRTHDLGTHVAFEDDGAFTGYFGGCEYGYTEHAHFQSTAGNGAATIEPNLCPVGKYGYDPRCRGWYNTGKNKYLESGTPFHITPPYRFASLGITATSATSPLANHEAKQYIGQVLFDFYHEEIRQSLEGLAQPVSFMITPQNDATGGDTVVGPDKTKGWESVSISSEVLPYDDPGSANKDFFENVVLKEMKQGRSGYLDFDRSDVNGATETLTLAYWPVSMRVLLPLSPSDFSRGVLVESTLVYSVGIANYKDALRKPFEDIEAGLYADLQKRRIWYICLVVFVSMLFALFSCTITLYVTKPIMTLLRAVQAINAGKTEQDIPPLPAGSREMHQVYNSFAKLYKIVRMSNVAFFSGNLAWAYHIINDALKLFRKVDDQKAVGVACNNLGNTLYAMVHQSRYDGKSYRLEDGECSIQSALSYYDEAIAIGQREFDLARAEEVKAGFAQQLADRLFNRGLFLLLVNSDVSNAKQRAIRDITKARDLDYDVKDFWMARKLLLKNSATYFSRLVRRIHGLIDVYDDDEIRSVWDAKSLVQEADQLLFAAWNEPGAPLFEHLSPVGRLQELEGAVIRLDLMTKQHVDAARLAMRMFCEDEYLLESSFVSAAKALLQLLKDGGSSQQWSTKTKSSAKSDLRKMVNSCRHVTLDMGKCLVFAIEINEKWEGFSILDKINENCLKLYDLCAANNDYVGVVAYTTRGDLNVELGMKGKHFARQRSSLDMATTSTNDRDAPSLRYAMQILVDSAATTENDSYILLVTDGESWEPAIFSSTKTQIERLNRERSTSIHVILLGIDLEEEEILEHCKILCSVSKRSMFVEVDVSNVEETFDAIAAVITGRGVTFGAFQGITMEKF